MQHNKGGYPLCELGPCVTAVSPVLLPVFCMMCQYPIVPDAPMCMLLQPHMFDNKQHRVLASPILISQDEL